MCSPGASVASGCRLGIRHLIVELTNACNHRCSHCYGQGRLSTRREERAPTLSRTAIREVVARVHRDTSLEHVALSGGEPSLRDDLPGIVSDLTDDGLGVVVITNGSRLASAPLDRFPRGTVFGVTLFSSEARTHNRMAGRASFLEVMKGLSRLERSGHHLAVTIVVARANAHELGRTIRLALAAGAGAVLVNRVNLTRHTLPDANHLVPSISMLREAMHQADDVAERYDAGIAVSVPMPPCLVDPDDFPHLQFCWCPRGSSDSYYAVGPQGWLRPCNHSSRVLGDLLQKDFGDIVTSRRTRAFWATMPAACQACTHPLAKHCLGGCPAAADESLGTRRRMDPFIAAARGLFDRTNRVEKAQDLPARGCEMRP